VIRFGIVLSVVLIAIGLLVTGVVAGSLLLVVISIGVALLAFLGLIVVVISFRHEIFGRKPLDVAAAQPSLAARGEDRSERRSDDVGDRSRGTQPTVQPVPRPASAEAADRRRQTATTRPQAQPASLSKAQPKAEPAAPEQAGSRARAEEPAERERGTVERAQPEPASAGPAGDGRDKANFEGSDRNRLAAQHGAGRLDRPSPEQPAEQARAEPRKPSRLERESARAAGSRSPAAETSSSGGRPADAPEKPDVFRPAAAGTAVSGTAAKPAPAATPAGAGAMTGEPDADAPASDTAAEPARAQAGPAVTVPPSTSPAGTGETDAALPGGTGDQEPDTSMSEGQAGNGEPAGSQESPASRPASDDQDNGAAGESSAAGDDEMQVSVVPGITRYHKSDCQLIRFLSADDLEVMTKRAATDAGCVPCKACKPDQVASGATSG
jgi:hypothetical protein